MGRLGAPGLLVVLLGCSPGGQGPGDDSGPGADEVGIADVTARLHPDLGSLVYVAWTQDVAAPARVVYSFDGDTLETPEVAAVAGVNEALLLGVPYGVTVEARVTAGATTSGAVSLATEPLPDGLPLPAAVSGDPTAWEPTLRYLWMSISEDPPPTSYGLAEPWWTLVLDRAGRVVWARRTDGAAASLHPRVSVDGADLLLDESTYWGSFDGGRDSRILRMKIDGTVVETIATPGLHHAFTDTPDGALLWNAADGADETIEELGPDGARRSVWRCSTAVEAAGGAGDCGSNTLSWREDTGTLLFSSYTLGTVFEVDRAGGETLRTFGQLPGSYSMDPAASNFWWQHGVHVTDEGTLLVSVYREAGGGETIVREYAIDAGEAALREVWNAGLGSGIFGRYMGEPHRLPGGNTLHNAGSEPRIREYTPDGEVVWDVDFGRSGAELADAWMGRTTPVADLYAFLPR